MTTTDKPENQKIQGSLCDLGQMPSLPPPLKKRGRKPTGRALSSAERQKRYRQRHQPVELGERMTATVNRLAKQFDLPVPTVMRELIKFALSNRNWEKTGFSGAISHD